MIEDFKRAGVSDLDTLVGLMREFYAFERLDWDEVAARKAASGLLADSGVGLVWFPILSGEVTGYIALTFGFALEYAGRDAFIDELYLRATYRGQGIGTEILQFVEAEARKLGIGALHLVVESNNRIAQQFYLRNGFKEQPRVLMTRRL